MSRRSVLLVVGVAAAVITGLSTGCSRAARPLASVAGHDITQDDLEDAIAQQAGRSLPDASPDLVAAVFEARLEEEVLLASSGTAADRELAGAARSARARELLASLCPLPPSPGEAEVAAEVARLAASNPAGERIHLRQLILPDRSAAEKARERARAGEDFETLSRELSRAPNADHGGALGWVERGQLPPEFEAAAFPLAAGETSPPVPSNAGWHVFQVTERRAAGEDEGVLRARVQSELAARAAETARDACLRALAAKVGVDVVCAEARFPCRNPFLPSSTEVPR